MRKELSRSAAGAQGEVIDVHVLDACFQQYPAVHRCQVQPDMPGTLRIGPLFAGVACFAETRGQLGTDLVAVLADARADDDPHSGGVAAVNRAELADDLPGQAGEAAPPATMGCGHGT